MNISIHITLHNNNLDVQTKLFIGCWFRPLQFGNQHHDETLLLVKVISKVITAIS